MGQRIGKERITRENGYLYYLGKDGYIWKTPTALNKKGKKVRVGTEKIARDKGTMYYLDKSGYVAKAKMRIA